MAREREAETEANGMIQIDWLHVGHARSQEDQLKMADHKKDGTLIRCLLRVECRKRIEQKRATRLQAQVNERGRLSRGETKR
jgi:hypothetical protein